jgi:hypothetical protein
VSVKNSSAPVSRAGRQGSSMGILCGGYWQRQGRVGGLSRRLLWCRLKCRLACRLGELRSSRKPAQSLPRCLLRTRCRMRSARGCP